MLATSAINPDIIKKWITDNVDAETIKEELRSRGFEEAEIALHLSAFKKKKCTKRITAGVVCIVAGSIIGFISCVLTVFNPIPEMHNLFLYGFTLTAILLVFVGLYLVFEY